MNLLRCWIWSSPSRRQKLPKNSSSGCRSVSRSKAWISLLGASIGIATFPDCGSNLDGLLRASDIAMYEAKRAGRQQYRFYDHEMNGRARSRLMLEDSVRTAIENQDFNLVYQPQVAIADGRFAASKRCCAGSTRALAMCRRGCFCRCWRRRG